MKFLLAGLLCAIFVLRAPSAIRNPRARASWAATGLGGLGLLITDTFAPYVSVDHWLGGMNFAHLIRSLLLSSSAWFLRSSIIQATGAGLIRTRSWKYHPLVLFAALGSITLPFLLADTRGSNASFVTEEGSQFGVFLYAAIYMLFVGLICLDMAWLLRGHWRGWLGLMRIGAITAALACFDEVTYAIAIWSSLGNPLFLSISFAAFNLVYLGVALIILSLAMLALKPVQLVQRTIAALLERSVARCNRKTLDMESIYAPHEEPSSNPRTTIYRHVIALKDIEAQEGLRLGPITARILSAGERILTQSAPARPQHESNKGNHAS